MKKHLVVLILMFATIGGATARDVQVKGYMKEDGTVVAPTTRTIKDKTVEVSGYTKKNGKYVPGYTRKKAK